MIEVLMDKRKKGIGEIIGKLRTEQKVTLEQLSSGICTASELSKIEQNRLEADPFLLDRLFMRMGKSVERLEYVLSMENYKLYELRQKIQKSIAYRDLDLAEIQLNEYKEGKHITKSIHRQYVFLEYAQIAWLGGEGEKALNFIEKAIGETMPLNNALRSETALSAEELKILLFRCEICMDLGKKDDKSEIDEIIEYLYRKKIVQLEAVKAFPYAAFLYGKKYMGAELENGTLRKVTEAALSLLRDTGKILFLPEILEQYIGILKKDCGSRTFIDQLCLEKESLVKIEKQYGINLDKCRMYEYVSRRFEIDNELIRKTRIAFGITQEKLSEDICAQESLARIESGKRSPRSGNLEQLMEKMGRNGERVSAVITTGKYEILELKHEFEKYVHRSEYKKAEIILDKIEERINCDLAENLKYIQTERIMLSYYKKTVGSKETLSQLWELIGITINLKECDWAAIKLSTEEMHILSLIAFVYASNGEEELAMQIYQLQVQQFEQSQVMPVFHILEWELAMSNLATSLEERKKPVQAIEISEKKIRVSLEAGKGKAIGRSLITIACAKEQMQDKSDIEYFSQGLHLLKLFKMTNQYESVKEYLSKKGISLNN